MVRLHADGSTNNSFGLGGNSQISMDCWYSAIFGLMRQDDGKLLDCGYASDNFDSLRLAVARFKENGLVDQSFGDLGRVIIELEPDSLTQFGRNMALQPDGKILVLGFKGSIGHIHTGLCAIFLTDVTQKKSTDVTQKKQINIAK